VPSDEVEWLSGEVVAWQREGLVTKEQAELILARYASRPAPTPGAVDRSMLGQLKASGQIVVAISVLGAVLLGLGVILFFASNWESIPRPLRVALLVAATAGAYYLGWRLEFGSKRYPKVGAAVILLGGLLYGASIFLVAQMYNVNEDALADLLLLWLVGTLPAAYALRSAFTSLLNGILFATWIGFRMGEARPAVDFEIFPLAFVALGAAYYAAGKLQASWPTLRRHALPFRALGAFLAAAGLYALTFEAERDFAAPGGGVLLLYLVLVVAAGAAAVAAHARGTATREASALETGALLGLAALPVVALLLPFIVDDLLANLWLALFIVALILVGYRSRDVNLVNLALAFAVVDIVTRYFDFFYDLLPRSLFFMAGGALMLAGAWFGERERRKLVARMKEGAA
jgi:uncharacterized membrane protein